MSVRVFVSVSVCVRACMCLSLHVCVYVFESVCEPLRAYVHGCLYLCEFATVYVSMRLWLMCMCALGRGIMIA